MIELKGFLSFDQFLNENLKTGSLFVVSYGGKFSPFHSGHFEIYEKICKQFGKDNVFITTSDLPVKPDPTKHFLNFEEKSSIMTKMFKIPSNRIFKVKNNYAPMELLNQFPESTIFVTVLGQKDVERLVNGKYFKWMAKEDVLVAKNGSDLSWLQGYKESGYVWIEENWNVNLSATEIREFFRNPANSLEDKERFFKKIYGKMDAGIFNMLDSKIK